MVEAEFRNASTDESDEIVTLVAEVFHGSTKHYHAMLHGDPLLDFDHIQVAVMDGRIVSTVWVIPRAVRWCGGTMTVGGIGIVVTHPHHRGRGYATRRSSKTFVQELHSWTEL
ncbi:MAG: GNAT family N-acetyltransferase [Armatimonadetes bacterium]|nr:GNAT family N-acetyltransferase [Armatimonadota bacterium]